VIGLIVITEVERTSSTWWKSNTTNDYRDMTCSSLHTRSSKCIICLIHAKKLSAWWVVHKVNPHERLYTLDDAGYHDTLTLDDDVDEVYQEEELSAYFVNESGAGLDDLVGDTNDIQMPMKQK
jgi:hypothetical protein